LCGRAAHIVRELDGKQKAVDDNLITSNTRRPYEGRGMSGRAPRQVFIERMPKAKIVKGVTTKPKQPKLKTA
jgi:hypothetical protein